MEEEKYCCNCKYLQTRYNEEPCCDCHGRSKWESNKGGFKSGDLVVGKNNLDIKPIYIYLRNHWVLRVPNHIIVRSNCDYCISDYIDKLIVGNKAQWMDSVEYADSENIEKHDNRAREFYIIETLNSWFSKLIGEEPKKKENLKDLYKKYINEPIYTTPNTIKNVIFSDPATIIFWEDGTKTVVKTQDGEKYDKEKGFAMAVCKKVFGNERDYYHVFKRWMRKGKEV